MHELSLAGAIVDTAVRHADGRPVRSVQMRIGAMRQVVPESLDFYFGIVTRGTLVEGASLEVDYRPVRLRCGDCAHEWEPDLPIFRCPGCGGAAVETLSGTEFEIDSITVEEREEAETPCIAPR